MCENRSIASKEQQVHHPGGRPTPVSLAASLVRSRVRLVQGTFHIFLYGLWYSRIWFSRKSVVFCPNSFVMTLGYCLCWTITGSSNVKGFLPSRQFPDSIICLLEEDYENHAREDTENRSLTLKGPESVVPRLVEGS